MSSHRSCKSKMKTVIKEMPMALLSRLEMLKDMVQEAIDKGATSVEEVHKAIARIPFEVAARSGLLEDDLQKKQDLALQPIGYVYDKIREINRLIGDMASDVFEAIEDAKHVDNVIKEKGLDAKREEVDGSR
ncbi:Hypothetical protein HDN1F_21460 [gamma proteobacterium HdN1]|nr:Hypothetical protein HDN1F_21460 [gamma proteobacterium HdN1]